jgi:hypothetical protein
MGSGRRGDLVLASYRNNLSIGGAGIGREMLKEKFAAARTRSPARETRALPFRSEFGSSDDARWDKP